MDFNTYFGLFIEPIIEPNFDLVLIEPVTEPEEPQMKPISVDTNQFLGRLTENNTVLQQMNIVQIKIMLGQNDPCYHYKTPNKIVIEKQKREQKRQEQEQKRREKRQEKQRERKKQKQTKEKVLKPKTSSKKIKLTKIMSLRPLAPKLIL